jgi:cell division ATPase FtsA
MAMARPSVINDSLAALGPLDIRPTDLVPAPAALFCGFACAESDTDGPCLIVDIGAVKTEIAIGTDEGLLFARAFPMGGRQFTEAIAKGGACPLQQADSQKLRDATLADGGPFSEFLIPVAERWYSQFSAVLAAYRSAVSGNGTNVSTIILSGGGSKLNGFAEWFAKRVNQIPVSTGTRPTLARQGSTTSINVMQASELPCPSGISDFGTFATALGLALTSLDAPKLPHLSLIPESLRDEVVFKEKKPYWIATAATLILAIGVFTAGLLISLSRDSVRLEAERQELRKREKIDKEIAAIRAETEAIRKEAVPLRRLLVGGPASRYAVSLVATSIAPADWISLVSDEETYLRHEAPKPVPEVLKPARPGFFVPGFRDNDPKAKESSSVFADAEAKPAPDKSKFTAFVIEGYTPDMSFKSVDEMLRRIRGGARVKSVDLLSDDKVKPPAELPEAIKALNLPEMRRFVVRMEVALP